MIVCRHFAKMGIHMPFEKITKFRPVAEYCRLLTDNPKTTIYISANFKRHISSLSEYALGQDRKQIENQIY